MKTKLHLTTLLAILVLSTSAQTTFQKVYSGSGSSWHFPVQKTTDGGYIIAGETLDYGEGLPDVYVIKTDSLGDTLWTKTYGGTNFDRAESIKQTTDGGYIIAGQTYSFGSGNGDVYLIKTDSFGDTLWTRAYGFLGTENAYDVLQTSDGGYIITGTTGSIGVGDIYLIKTDPSGIMTWNKTLGYGGIGMVDTGFGVLQNSDNSYIVVGQLVNNNSGQVYTCLIKTNSTGDTLWTKSYIAGTGVTGYSVQHTIDNGYIIIGETRNSGLPDVLAMKTDNNGDLIWSKTYGDVSTDDVGYYIEQTSDNGYIISGFTGNVGGVYYGYVLKTNSTGDTLWTKQYGTYGDDAAYWIHQINGGYITSGVYSNGLGGYNICLIKMDSNGNIGECNDSTSNLTVNVPTIIESQPNILTNSIGSMNYTSTKMSNGGVVTNACPPLGIRNISNEDIFLNIFPNPFLTQTIINSNIDLKYMQFIICNMLGQEVKTMKNISGQAITLNRDNLPSGLYFIHLTQDNNVMFTGKLVITD